MNCTFPAIKMQLRFANQTIVDWSSFYQKAVYDVMVVQKIQLDGYGHTVEIDESKFGTKKYHRGHRVENRWVFVVVVKNVKPGTVKQIVTPIPFCPL